MFQLQLFHLEVLEFKKIFLRNGYPSKFIYTCIYKFLNRIFTKKEIKDTVLKKEFEIILPFLGPLSNKVHRRIKNLFQKIITTGNIRIVYKTTYRLSHVFRFKDSIPSDLRSHVLYHFKCPICNNGYIGETRVHFKVRSCQHLGISPFSDKPISGGVPTAITKHIEDNKCKCSLSDFKIIGSETDYHKRLIKESLFIKVFDYDLNKQQTSTALQLF